MTPGQAFYREAGRGPAVVCIHASGSSSSQWRLLTERLAGRFRVLEYRRITRTTRGWAAPRRSCTCTGSDRPICGS
jgi:pimeloyl-ACP methyl ester carboxylesterase